MTKYEKLIKIMNESQHGIRYDEMKKVLKVNGFEFVRQKGSHTVFRHNETGETIVIPKKSPVKKCYVEDIMRRIRNDERK